MLAVALPDGDAVAKASLPTLTPTPPQSPIAKKFTVASGVFKVSLSILFNEKNHHYYYYYY